MTRRLALAAVLGGLALAGCASADKHQTASASAANAGAVVSGQGSSAAGSGSSAGGMNMGGSGGGQAPTPVPIRPILSARWKVMAIDAREMTPVPFYIDNGTSEREVKVPAHASFHLMVTLTDSRTHMPIPYANVWATVKRDGRTIFNERQWPMLSEYMGPHYGNNIALPGPGRYTLSLLVSAPAAALHTEYANMWNGTHTVSSTFTWK